MKKALLVLGVLAVLGFFAVGGYNRIVTIDEKVNAAWAEVHVQYQRRADLIPNIVSTVKGYAAHEKETLTGVIEARAKATSMTVTPETLNDPEAFQKFEQAQGSLSQALSRLMMVTEKYPDLQANQNFMALQAQLEGTENRIAIARRDYVLAVQEYNVIVRKFPTVIWAKLFGAHAKPSFSSETGAEKAPKVEF